MTQQPHNLSNLRLARSYFESLPSDDISRRYAAGQKYISSWFSRFTLLFSVDSKLSQLSKFYPYQPIVKKTNQLYQQRKEEHKKAAFAFSGISILAVYQLAKQNYVMPIFNKFCILKTHRLFRQYLALAFFPIFFAVQYTNYFFLNQTQKLWATHASRLNAGKLDDPEDSQYPRQMLEVSQRNSYVTPYVHKFDLAKKWANEVLLFLAPDYQPVEDWQKAPLKQAEEEEQGDDGDEDEDEE